ncbi:hypothetical protein WR25_25436 [Diploscapter pachys]|uniref:Uncharacterized protein n=1 Tax=Diploscapter pachys TaxID=2018661 RepID=A0A2A2J2C6_9BILA|nr:hypothetical protein WR25_25436 [Diploscapter pachys]
MVRTDRPGPSPVARSCDPSSLRLPLILSLFLCNRIKNLRIFSSSNNLANSVTNHFLQTSACADQVTLVTFPSFVTVTLGLIGLVWLLTVSVASMEGIKGLPVSVPVDVTGSFDNSQDRLEFEKT